MAKKRSGTSKTSAIKDYMRPNPASGPREVADALKAQGLDISPQYVSTIKSKLGLGGGGRGGKKKRGRPAGSTATATAASGSSRKAPSSVAYENLVEAKNFVRSIGNIDQARRALDAYAALQ